MRVLISNIWLLKMMNKCSDLRPTGLKTTFPKLEKTRLLTAPRNCSESRAKAPDLWVRQLCDNLIPSMRAERLDLEFCYSSADVDLDRAYTCGGKLSQEL